MVTFIDLRDSQPSRLGPAADAWVQLARDAGRLESRVVGDLTRPLRTSGWSGQAATIAFRVCDGLDDEFELAARQVRNAAAVIRHARVHFVKAQDDLKQVIQNATRQGLRVDNQGVVHPPEMPAAARNDPAAQRAYMQLAENARIYTEQIRAIVSHATNVDNEASRVLRLFKPHTAGQMAPNEWRDASQDARAALALLGMSERDIPAADAPAQQARNWWNSLTDEQRSLYLAAHPDRVGALNGLPVGDRHAANTIALRQMVDSETGPTSGRVRTLLDRLEASEYGPDARRLYLLGVDNRGDGQAVVSVGNPDTARHVGVLVPGMNTTLDGMGAQIDRAGDLRQTADDLTANVTGDVAVVAWLGYDTPNGLGQAMTGRFAEAGAPNLDRFVDGVNVANNVEGERRVVVAHSYGATVVGLAASRGDGLAANDIVTAGAPGMRVENVHEFRNITPNHVWAGAANDDPVSDWGDWAHNTSPHDRDFGANRYRVDTHGHVDYWRPGTESLRNQAHILVGQYDRVTLEHTAQPERQRR